MSRAGRRARRARLVAAGTLPPETDADRAALLHAERARWIRAVGWVGWHTAAARRRAARVAQLRSQRLEREARSGKPPQRGKPNVPLVLEMLDETARAKLIARMVELDTDNRLIREIPAQRPPDPPLPLARAAVKTTERTTP